MNVNLNFNQSNRFSIVFLHFLYIYLVYNYNKQFSIIPMSVKSFFALILFWLFFSCNTANTPFQKSDLSGYWEQQGEGEIIAISDSVVISYHSTKFNCYPNWKISREYFNTQTPTITVNPDGSFTNIEGYTVHTYLKLKRKPTQCKELTENQINSNTYNFETFWTTFNEQYAFFKERKIDWNLLKKKCQGQFTDETKPFEFYLLLEKMVLEIKDSHSDFEVPDEFDEQWHLMNKEIDTTDYKTLAQGEILEKYVRNSKSYKGQALKWGLISGDLAYIQFNDMYDLTENGSDDPKELIASTHRITSSIVNDIRGTRDCIIDLRFNGGGYDWLGLAFISHFIDKKYDVFRKKNRNANGFSNNQTISIQPSDSPYTGNVYILTGPYTVSAAETTILATMNFPAFTRIGSDTRGALSDVLYKKLPNGWTYWLSNEVYEGMNGKVYEVIGIPPDHRITYPEDEKEFFKALNEELKTRDRAIQKVLALTK